MGALLMTAIDDGEFERLCRRVLASADVYQIVALHPWLSAAQRTEFEAVIFSHPRHALRFARESYTPASIIERLAQEDNELIWDKLAKNPATPSVILKQLASCCQSASRLLSIAKHDNASVGLLESLEIDGNAAMRRAACHNSNTGLAQLKRLLTSASLDECKGIARNPQADADLLNALWQSSDEKYLRAEIATHEACPADLLTQALDSELPLLRRKAASNAKLSSSQLMHLLGDSEAQVRAAALRHLGANNIQLIDEPARRVRRELARKSGLDTELIAQLSVDEDNWVRRWVARNPATPKALLRVLAQDSEAEVRRGVARNPLLTKDLCKKLACDAEAWVRAGISIRPGLDTEFIQQLSTDDSIDVLSGLGRNPASPETLLVEIAGHPDRDVRRAVILNPQAPLSVLQTLIEDPYAMNRMQLSRHGAMKVPELLQLLEDPEPQVRFSAVQALATRVAGSGRRSH
jgi:hypothetical protein